MSDWLDAPSASDGNPSDAGEHAQFPGGLALTLLDRDASDSLEFVTPPSSPLAAAESTEGPGGPAKEMIPEELRRHDTWRTQTE